MRNATTTLDAAYKERGFGWRQGLGKRSALVVVDLCHGFTEPSSPLCCDCDGALLVTAELLGVFRSARLPVIYTTVVYDTGTMRTAAAFIAKAPALRQMRRGTRWTEVDGRVAPAADEPVLEKLFASAFFGTGLSSLLATERCDSIVVVGASTSGCVRATAVDGVQHGYRVTVVSDAVADRLPEAHDASLRDIDAKYGDVVDAATIITHLTCSGESAGVGD